MDPLTSEWLLLEHCLIKRLSQVKILQFILFGIILFSPLASFALEKPENYTAPRICIREFNPQDQFSNEEEYLTEITESILDWETKLQQKEKRTNQWIWEMDVGTVYYSPSEPWPDVCHAGVVFFPFPYDGNKSRATYASVKNYDDFPVIEIFYLKNLPCSSEEITEQKNIETAYGCYNKEFFLNENEIGVLLRHELGHIFGLAHNEEYEEKFTPSIMIPSIETNPRDEKITDFDINNIRKLFPTGFYDLDTEKTEDQKNDIIPQWIRNNAAWWASDLVSDGEFIEGMKFLIENEIIVISSTTNSFDSKSDRIPSWIKMNANWWSKGLISDDDFLKGIQYLIQKGIIVVN